MNGGVEGEGEKGGETEGRRFAGGETGGGRGGAGTEISGWNGSCGSERKPEVRTEQSGESRLEEG